MRWTVLDSPIGEFSVATDGTSVCGAHFGRVEAADRRSPTTRLSRQAVDELRAYFAGELTGFTVPVSVPRGSEFERAVWREMTRDPVRGDADLRRGRRARSAIPAAARAVGVACNRNPMPVIVPCHRIVGAGGKLVGFGGGLPRKVSCWSWRPGSRCERAWS